MAPAAMTSQIGTFGALTAAAKTSEQAGTIAAGKPSEQAGTIAALQDLNKAKETFTYSLKDGSTMPPAGCGSKLDTGFSSSSVSAPSSSGSSVSSSTAAA